MAATNRHVIVGDRDLADLADVFRCYHADTGEVEWTIIHPAPGNLDYGNTPRATPVIVGDVVYLFGAFGHLHCVELRSGRLLWQKHLEAEFGPVTERLPWGLCATPLVAEGRIIVAPGSEAASVAALDAATGETIWKAAGGAPGYGSFIVAELGGVKQIIGHDAESLGGWDWQTGKRLWRLVPPKARDYNVPTPIVWNGCLLVSTENNGTRLYAFDSSGVIKSEPIAVCKDLAPDTHTPVLVGNRLLGIHQELMMLDLSAKLAPVATLEDGAFGDHTTLIAADDRLLILSQDGELVLASFSESRLHILDRGRPFADEKDIYSHPALVGTRLYVRGNEQVYAFDLASQR